MNKATNKNSLMAFKAYSVGRGHQELSLGFPTTLTATSVEPAKPDARKRIAEEGIDEFRP